MKTSRWVTAWAVLSGLLLSACLDEPSCPDGARKVGSRCVAQSSSTADADGGVDQAPDAGEEPPDECQPEPERCGDGIDNDCDGTVDEGSPESCNGVDDDCDGRVDEEVLNAFYEDRDGDGVGSGEATLSCEAPKGFVAAHGDCDDSDAALSPEADEVCDGLDNNCDGEPDEAFACVQGTLTECVTQCGSIGSGTCTDACEPPTGAACALPAESCNFVDDDCDGIVDEDLWERTPLTHVWSAAGDQNPRVASLPRPGGGSWVLYQAMAQSPQGVSVEELDETGAHVRTVPDAHQRTAGLLLFLATAVEEWIVVAGSEYGAAGTATVNRVQVYRAEDFTFVSEHTFASDGPLVAISALTDDGGPLHVLLLSTSGSGTYARVLRRSAADVWSGPTSPVQITPSPSTALDIAVERIPCREEWVVATSGRGGSDGKNTGKLQRLDLDGTLVGGEVPLYGAWGVVGLGRSETDCNSRDPELLVMVLSDVNTPDTTRTGFVRFRVGRTSGAFSQALRFDLAKLGVANATILHHGGRWLVAGLQFTDKPGPYLAEMDGAATALRRIPLAEDPSSPNPGGGSYIPFASSLSGMTAAGSAITLTFGKVQGSNLDEVYQQANPGDSDVAAAVTYTIGCR